MQLYIAPTIKRVILNPEQAILEVCSVGGIYMAESAQDSVVCGAITLTGFPFCAHTPKGAEGGGTMINIISQANRTFTAPS